jgi:broad specificity phosphatase PhoE
MTTIYLVRHGITAANQENRFAGRSDEELHARGIEQIRQVGEHLRHKNVTAVYCGPARRTVQSAEILGSKLNVPVMQLAELDEILIPHWDGLTKEEIRRNYGMEYPTWLDAPHTFRVPGCETLKQVQNRAAGALNHLLAENRNRDGNLLIVSHLIVLRCLVLYCTGKEISGFRAVQIDNGAIISISGDESGRLQVSTV